MISQQRKGQSKMHAHWNVNMEPKYVVRRRVVFGALAVLVTVVTVWALSAVAANLWWVDGGYCWGDYAVCVENVPAP